jgi:hypothetical protein
MGELRYFPGRFAAVAAFIGLPLLLLSACGGHKPTGASPFPAKITLAPTLSASMQLGSVLAFTAVAQNGANANINPTFSYALTPTSPPGILEISPNGIACAGSWNAPYYSVCTPAGIGVVQVVATALGATSPPTTVFVHAPIDEIEVSVVPPVNSPPAACATQIALPAACKIPFNTGNCSTINGVLTCGCLSTNQQETLQAKAFSQGTDITSSVGPFTWTEANLNVVTVTPITTSSTNVPTNQATVVSNTPGATQLVASASGVSSQPYIAETCPVQCIALSMSQNGSQNPNQTSFSTAKGTAEMIAATAVDIQGCIVPKPALTWTSSEPAAIAAGGLGGTTGGTGTTGTGTGTTGTGTTGTGCAAGSTCTIATNQPGVAAITASCTPPTCNIGFPLTDSTLSALYLPEPVYPVTAISGLVTGPTTATNVLASSQDCYSTSLCNAALFNISTSKNIAGSPNLMPTPPNSLMFDPAGDKAYAGSEYGAELITVANLGTSNSPFTLLPAPETQLGVVTGKVIAVSPNGNLSVFSDTVNTPNQVYVVNGSTSAVSATPWNIDSATTATFSPDNSKAFILGNGGNTLYVYSALQALQTYPLAAPANAVTFSSAGTFAMLAGGNVAGGIDVLNTCNNQPANATGTNGLAFSITGLNATPLFLKMIPAGNVPTSNLPGALIPTLVTIIPNTNPPVSLSIDFFYGVDNTGIDIIATATSTPLSLSPTTPLCPLQTLALATNYTTNLPFPPLYINLQHGTFHPIKFFVSPDSTQIYIVTSDQGILEYNLSSQSLTAIPLLNNAAPVAADMTVDGTLIYVAGTDGVLHYVNTQLMADQPNPVTFTQLPNSSNDFCTLSYSCSLDLVAVKP